MKQDVERYQGEGERKTKDMEKLEQEKKHLLSKLDKQLVDATKDAHKYLEDKKFAAEQANHL